MAIQATRQALANRNGASSADTAALGALTPQSLGPTAPAAPKPVGSLSLRPGASLTPRQPIAGTAPAAPKTAPAGGGDLSGISTREFATRLPAPASLAARTTPRSSGLPGPLPVPPSPPALSEAEKLEIERRRAERPGGGTPLQQQDENFVDYIRRIQVGTGSLNRPLTPEERLELLNSFFPPETAQRVFNEGSFTDEQLLDTFRPKQMGPGFPGGEPIGGSPIDFGDPGTPTPTGAPSPFRDPRLAQTGIRPGPGERL